MNRNEYMANLELANELYHHGVKGQKWGVRRYQNEDGTLNSNGRARYGGASPYMTAYKLNRDARNDINDANKKRRDSIKIAKFDKRAGNISRNEYKTIKKESTKRYNSDVQNIYNNNVKVFAQTHSKGKTIAAGTLATIGGVAATGTGVALLRKGKRGVSDALVGVGGILIGAGIADYSNAAVANKYWKNKKK